MKINRWVVSNNTPLEYRPPLDNLIQIFSSPSMYFSFDGMKDLGLGVDRRFSFESIERKSILCNGDSGGNIHTTGTPLVCLDSKVNDAKQNTHLISKGNLEKSRAHGT